MEGAGFGKMFAQFSVSLTLYRLSEEVSHVEAQGRDLEFARALGSSDSSGSCNGAGLDGTSRVRPFLRTKWTQRRFRVRILRRIGDGCSGSGTFDTGTDLHAHRPPADSKLGDRSEEHTSELQS